MRPRDGKRKNYKHRIIEVGKYLLSPAINTALPSPPLNRVPLQGRQPRALLNTSGDGDSTTSLSQCSITCPSMLKWNKELMDPRLLHTHEGTSSRAPAAAAPCPCAPEHCLRRSHIQQLGTQQEPLCQADVTPASCRNCTNFPFAGKI